MHCIITSDENVINYAKKKGARVIKVEKSVTIKNGREIKYSNITPEIVDRFLQAFPGINYNSLGAKSLKYILENRLGYEENLETTVYPIVAKKLKVDTLKITWAIMSVYSDFVIKIPECYKSFFEDEECCIHWDKMHSVGFVKCCQKYLDENAEKLKESMGTMKKLAPTTIESFLARFGTLKEDSLGYKYIKYILENDLPCNGDYDKEIYPVLMKKFGKDLRGIRMSLTCSLNHCIKCAPREYKKIFEKYDEYKGGKDKEGRNFLLLRLFQLYLNKHEIA